MGCFKKNGHNWPPGFENCPRGAYGVPMANQHLSRLIYADSEHCADMLYATGMHVPDPFLWARIRGKTYVVLSDLELGRGRRQARVDAVVPLSSLGKDKSKRRRSHPPAAENSALFLRRHRVRRVEVPHDFPLGMANLLHRHGITVQAKNGPFFPSRISKGPKEVASIKQTQRMAEAAMARCEEVLSASRPGRNKLLVYAGRGLTSEFLQGEINACLARMGATAAYTIVAGGNQACDPHEMGHGPLRAHAPIIVDIFPRTNRTGYWGDITRTFVRRTPSDAAGRLYEAVLDAQKDALSKIRTGADGRRIQREARALFESRGFSTGEKDGRCFGFFHGLGHGVGLEIHERPRFSDGPLPKNAVVSVEPGLYYPGIGGVRIEDLVVVTDRGPKNLTTYPKRFVLG